MEWLTEPQGSAHVGKSLRTLQRWRQAGEIVGYRQGPNRIMYRRTELEIVAQMQQQRYEQRPLPGRPKLVAI